MNKAFNNFAWKNYPDTGTPLEKSVLDKINNGLDEVDNRVVTYDTTKFDTAQAQLLVKNVELNENSGVLKVTYYNGSVSTYSSLLGKVAVNFDFNEESQKMIVYLSNGEEKEVDLSSFIMEYEFLESDSIYFTIDENSKIAFEQRAESLTIGQHIRGVLEEDGGKYKHIIVESEVEISEIHGVYYDAVGEGDNIVFKRNISDPRHFISAYCPGGIAQFNIYVEVNSDAEDYGANKKVIAYLQKKGTVSAHIKEGSIQEKHLRPDYLANIKAEVSKAEAVSGYAATAATTAGNNATLSKSWAVGDTNTRPGENTDNSKYYYQQSKSIYDNFSKAGNVTGVKGAAESAYRTGNVNLTPENIGALPSDGEAKSAATSKACSGTSEYANYLNIIRGNELRFGGLNGKNDTIYMNYRLPNNELSETAVTRYKFCNGRESTVGVTIEASEFSGNAASATKATQDSNGNVIKNTYLPLSGGTITGDLRLKGSGAYGNKINFGDGDYVHISEPTDDHLEIKGSYINFVTADTNSGKFTLNGKDILTIDKIYPVGSIYMSVNSTSPATLFGGTWVRWGNGRALVSVNESEPEFNTVEKVGGSKYLQEHDHGPDTYGMGFLTYEKGSTIQRAQIQKNASSGFYTHGANATNELGYSLKTSESGSGTSGNLQPYITCYMWKRTA